MLFLATLSCRVENPAHELARDYPRVDGSTSTHPLSMLIACRIQGVAYEWRRPPASERTVFPSPQNPIVAARLEETVRHHGTHEAYVALAEKKADLILVAREPSVREREMARRAGVGFDVHPIARDALVFVVNVNNSIENLTLEQIRGIFGTAATSSWIDVGGPDVPIEPYQRETDSGSQELIQKLVMKEMAIRDVPRIYTMAGVVNTVGLRDAGIAYSIFYYVTNMAPHPNVKMIAIDGVEPNAETIASGAYPLTSEVFAVMRKGTRADDPAARLLSWLRGKEGQAAVRESGYVPLGPR